MRMLAVVLVAWVAYKCGTYFSTGVARRTTTEFRTVEPYKTNDLVIPIPPYDRESGGVGKHRSIGR